MDPVLLIMLLLSLGELITVTVFATGLIIKEHNKQCTLTYGQNKQQ